MKRFSLIHCLDSLSDVRGLKQNVGSSWVSFSHRSNLVSFESRGDIGVGLAPQGSRSAFDDNSRAIEQRMKSGSKVKST